MAAQEDQAQQQQQQEKHFFTSPPPERPDSSGQIAAYTYPKVKRRKLQRSKRRRIQIQEKPPEPDNSNNTAQLVLYERTKKPRSQKQKRVVVHDFYDNSETKSLAMEKAEAFRATLEAEFPSFSKALVRSNVTVGFWMHLPMRFCKTHLPKNDTTVFLETEQGVEYILNYIAERTALSGGWKAFIGANDLHEGDVLIFHLVKPLKFKVYIVRGGSAAPVDGELDIQNLRADDNQIDPEQAEMEAENQAETELQIHTKTENVELPPVDPKENNLENRLITFDINQEQLENQFGNESKECGSKNLQVIASAGSIVDFKDIEGIENFSILVNGLPIDSELSDHYRNKYFELCCSQNAFLHENLLNNINPKLAAEIIIGTVDIAESIRGCKLSSSHSDYAIWGKTLKGFELLGMNVGFLRARLDRIMDIVAESEKAVESESREIRLQQERVDEEMKNLEMKLQKLKETKERLDDEIGNLKSTAEKHDVMFQEVANAPW